MKKPYLSRSIANIKNTVHLRDTDNYQCNRRDFNKLLALLICTIPFMTGCDLFKATLATECQPTSGGTISPSKGTYDNGVVVEISAIPSTGYRFDHWEGSVSGESSKVQVTMDGSKNVIAYFKKTYTLVISTSPSNGGSISPGNKVYDEGQTITLIASPAKYFTFNGWAGGASGSSDHITITMNSNKNVVASFIKTTYLLQTSIGTQGGGTIVPVSGSYEAGIQVTVTAIPSSGYRFDSWTGGIDLPPMVIPVLTSLS